MADERIISQANLSYIERNLNVLAGQIETVAEQVNHVDNSIKVVYSQVEKLANEFQRYVEQDIQDKSLQRALTEIIRVRQEIKNRYGHYEEVRRHTTGILQATDLSVVKKDTISKCTEELMLAAPTYWLAPCLIALAAWIQDDKELAERALREALRRDDEKTSLLFALISRRIGRLNGSLVWLERYFSMQNPTDMERKMIIVLDAFANGLFGADSKGLCATKVKEWIDELAEKPGFVEDQHRQWKTAVISKKPAVSDESYSYLSKYSPTWPQMKDVMSGAKLHNDIYVYFKNIFEAQPTGIKQISEQIDDLLDKLVSNYDNEELPLRREERMNQLVINAKGDERAAQTRYDGESTALEESVNFTQHLTNAAMSPETSHASYATQKLAVAFSRDWIVKAYDDITAENRSKIPVDIRINIEDWEGLTRDGSNEEELEQSLDAYVTKKMQEALENIKLTMLNWFGLIGGGALAFWGLVSNFNVLMIIIGIGGVIWYFTSNKAIQTKKEETTSQHEKFRDDSKNILKAIMAEVVDFRREFADRDAEYSQVVELLNAITPSQYIVNADSNIRQIAVSL